MTKPNIKDYICMELSADDRDIALDFVNYLEGCHLAFYKDNRNCWRDKIYYWVKYGDKCVCFIAINDIDEKDNRWTVWLDNMELPEKYPVGDDIKESAWRHIDHCGNCGSCSGGRRKSVFGRVFEKVCGCTFRVDNPNLDDLPFLKAMVDIAIKEMRGVNN
ncbi:MAG: hypothetical protein K2N06_03055 [Oscillospiraceae bacterium]|nr:hypothetical protein [Oscillospiraceae bacterium]